MTDLDISPNQLALQLSNYCACVCFVLLLFISSFFRNMSRFTQKNEEKYTRTAQKQWFICIKTVFVASCMNRTLHLGSKHSCPRSYDLFGQSWIESGADHMFM